MRGGVVLPYNNKIVIKTFHYYIASLLFHILIVTPVFLNLFQKNPKIITEIQEQIVYINFTGQSTNSKTRTTYSPPPKQTPKTDLAKAINKQPSPKSETKIQAKKPEPVRQAERKPSRKEIDNMRKDYEDKISYKVAVVMEENIDKYENLYGDFIVEFDVTRDGKVRGIRIVKKTDNAKANEELEDLLNNLRGFDPIPQSFPKLQNYKFHLPLSIE